MNFQTLLAKKAVYTFALITSLIIFIGFLIQHVLFTKDVYYRTLSEQLSFEQIDNLIAAQNKYEYLGYLLLTVFNLIKYSLLALIIQMGAFLWGYRINYNKIFKIVIISEFIFVIPIVIKFLFFYLFDQRYTPEEVQLFYPLSFLSAFPIHTISKLWIYPLQVINVFEVFYWFILAYGINKIIVADFNRSLKIVISSYLPALVIWMVFVLFITVTLTAA